MCYGLARTKPQFGLCMVCCTAATLPCPASDTVVPIAPTAAHSAKNIKPSSTQTIESRRMRVEVCVCGVGWVSHAGD